MTFAKTRSYTFEQYRNIDIEKELNRLDSMIAHVKKNKRLYLKLVVIVAMMFMNSGFTSIAYAATDVNQAISRIDTLGKQLWKLICVIGYWTVLLTTSKECIKEALNGDKRRVGNEVIKGVMIMAVIYFLPELFDMMKSIVSN